MSAETEKRLFWKDPSTGVETPLLVYQVDTNTVSDLSIGKQDKTDNSLQTSNKTVVGAINALNASMNHTMQEPFVSGQDGQVLTSNGDGTYLWKNSQGGVDVSLHYDPSDLSLSIVVTK